MYCASKAARSTQCTVFCAIPKEIAWEFNQQRTAGDVFESSETDNSSVPYTRDTFDALILRYEEPIANNRWDKPLFTLLPDSKIPFDDVYSSLYEMKPPPPNLATQNVRRECKFCLLLRIKTERFLVERCFDDRNSTELEWNDYVVKFAKGGDFARLRGMHFENLKLEHN